MFDDPVIHRPTSSPTLRRLRSWLRHFVKSPDFEDLRLFATRHEEPTEKHWSRRYTSYLLVPQYTNLENSTEQREAARKLSFQLREKFKVDLAFYTALSDQVRSNPKPVENPTALGEESLRMIKHIIARRGKFSYENIANIFKKQVQNLTYSDFKQALNKYLLLSTGSNDSAQALAKNLGAKLDDLYKSYEDQEMSDALLLRTCNRVIDYLTTEDHETPSPLFSQLMSKGSPLTLVILLLKLLLACKNVRTHMESRIADLIRYYEQFGEDTSQWVISFFEIFRIAMTIHADNVEYNLVSVSDKMPSSAGKRSISMADLDHYRVFSHARRKAEDPCGTEQGSTRDVVNKP